MTRTLVWAAALLILAGTVSLAAGQVPDVAPLLDIVKQKSGVIAEWEAAARLQIMLAVAGVIFGGLITLLQPWSSNKWCKVSAGMLGLTTAALTAFISRAPVSYAAYEKSALQARAKISALNDSINFLRASHDDASRAGFQLEFTKTVREINQIELKLSGDDKPAVAWLFHSAGVAYAQSTGSKPPAWVTKLQDTSTELYCRGASSNSNLTAARLDAAADALKQCGARLESIGKVSSDRARAYAAASASAAGSYFRYDDQTKAFRYFVLLSIDKTLASPGVIGALSVPSPTISLSVPANKPWTSTGILVQQGQKVSFSASGEIRWGTAVDKVANADGSLQKLSARLGGQFAYPVRGMGAGGLVARIDQGAPFRVGTSLTVSMPQSGTLNLGINDNSFGDNSGAFQVSITRAP